jgi:hypothetical protein
MWQLIMNLKDPGDASAVLGQIDSRTEVTSNPGVRVTKYPDDRQVVVRGMDRTPLAGLADWGLSFASARVALSDDSPYDEG